jgi:hypothetical protein
MKFLIFVLIIATINIINITTYSKDLNTSCTQPNTNKNNKKNDSISTTKFEIGIKNNSCDEFSEKNGKINFSPENEPYSDFPHGINLNSHPVQYLNFSVNQDEANRGLSFYLIPAHNNGKGALHIAIDCKINDIWREAGNTYLNATDAGYIDIPPPPFS